MDRCLRPNRLCIDPSASNATEEWNHWKKTFTNFLTISKGENNAPLSSEEKLLYLVNHVSASIYTLISDINTYDDAIAVLETTYVKPKNIIFARHCLSIRRQAPGESVDQYMQVLNLLSKDCDFRAVTAEENKNSYVRDAFIAGLTSSSIRQRLLENASLTLAQAFDQARALEAAQQHAISFQPPTLPMNAITADSHTADRSDTVPDNCAATSLKPVKCYFCGYRRHPRSACPAKDEKCKECGKLGHYSRVCQSRGKKSNSASATFNSDNVISAITAVSSPQSLQKAIVPVEINNIKCLALIDTGSSSSFLDSSLVSKCHALKLPSTERITMASSSLFSTVDGSCHVDLKLQGHVYTNARLLVMKNLCTDVIIGHDILSTHSSLEMRFGGSNEPLLICNLAAANVPPVSLFTNLQHDIRPIAIRSRHHSEEDSEFIKIEVQKLLRDGIIEPSVSPWRAQVLIVNNTNHKKRMCIDYSQTINRFTMLDAYPIPNIENIVAKVAKNSFYSTIDLKSAYHQVPILESEKLYTAFEADGNLYQFNRIPFGVTNGVPAFQKFINNIIQTEQLKETYAYLDDVTVCGRSKSEHDSNLQSFLHATQKYNLTVNEEKSKYSQTSINLLGYTISKNHIKPDEDRLQPLLKLRSPSNHKDLKRALGMFAHYARWIPHYSDRIRPLIQIKSFPLSPEMNTLIDTLKTDIAKSMVSAIDDNASFLVETDASDFAIAATLSQRGQPVAFFSRSLSDSELHHPAIEKEAAAIVEALRKWRHYLIGKHFRLVTDQRSVAFMFDGRRHSKIKNEKIMRWRLELSCYSYEIVYRPGKENTVADALSRISASSTLLNLQSLHRSLCHPGVTRLAHWVRTKNLPFSIDEVRKTTAACQDCAELKPRFMKNDGVLVHATSPFERLNIDFKGPLPSATRNRYLLTVVDEFSRFPFAFPCPDMSASTIIRHLTTLFGIFGTPAYIHSDRGASFMSAELKDFLTTKGVATSRTTAYNPRGNGQVERYNGIVWKTIQLALRSSCLETKEWEKVLTQALHSIRSLLCTSINTTPHERMFNHPRRSPHGTSIPTWLSTPGPVLMRRHVMGSKYEPSVIQVDLLEANPDYSYVRLPDGRETTVSNRHLAPTADGAAIESEPMLTVEQDEPVATAPELVTSNVDPTLQDLPLSELPQPQQITQTPRRSGRIKNPPKYLEDYVWKN